jgi:16S rRNA (guanine527-N7)-methyltransferase
MTGVSSLEQQLRQGIAELGLELPTEAPALLLRYLDELSRWNSAYNLTAIRAPREMVTRHLLDSLALLPVLDALLPASARVIDVGSGGGMPGIPLAIARPQWQVSLLDSNGKKARFLRHAVRQLPLPNADVGESRVEAYTPAQAYDAIVSRAFASLSDFFAATGALLAPGGVWVAMKGKLDAAERAAVPATITIREIRPLQVPGLREERHAVIAGIAS